MTRGECHDETFDDLKEALGRCYEKDRRIVELEREVRQLKTRLDAMLLPWILFLQAPKRSGRKKNG